MILNTLITLFFGIALAIIGLLPSATVFPSIVTDMWNWLSWLVAHFLYVLPEEVGLAFIAIGQVLMIGITALAIFLGLNLAFKLIFNRGK